MPFDAPQSGYTYYESDTQYSITIIHIQMYPQIILYLTTGITPTCTLVHGSQGERFYIPRSCLKYMNFYYGNQASLLNLKISRFRAHNSNPSPSTHNTTLQSHHSHLIHDSHHVSFRDIYRCKICSINL
jgi:hypothetical protein